MRILFVHESFGSFGGAEANVLQTASALKDRGHQIGLLHWRRTGRADEAWESVFGTGAFRAASAAEAEKFAGDFAPDVLYLHKWEELDSLEAMIEGRVPAVRMVHDHDLYCLRSYKYHPLTRRICRRPASGYCVFPCLAPLKRNRGGRFPFRWASYFAKMRELNLNRRCGRMLVASQYMKHELVINRFDESRIEVLAPVPRPAETVTPEFGDRNMLLYVGQIVRGKGVDALIRSLALVREPFEAVILGEGNHRPFCERLSVKLGLSGRISFRGFVEPPAMKRYFQEASAVLVSSVWPEPFGLVGIEAMRHGLPVVAFDAGGIGDWLHDGENGFLVDWMDRRAYAERVERLLRDKALARRMGEAGRACAAREYDFGAYLSRLEEVFRKAAGRAS